MYTQKIFQAGNSSVVAIPKELLRKYNLKPGNTITIKPGPDDSQLVIDLPAKTKPANKQTAAEKKHQEWLKVFMEEDSEILDELAKH